MTKSEIIEWLDEVIKYKAKLVRSLKGGEPEIIMISEVESIMVYQGIEKLAEILEENLTIIPYGDGYIKMFFKYKGIEIMQIERTK